MDDLQNKPRIGSARNVARQLLKDAKIDCAPIMIRDVVSHIKKSSDLSVYPWAFGDNTDGIQVTHGESATIGYNQDQHRHRQRFTVAHEIGHFMMGHTNGNSTFDLDSKKPEEIEANQFAAELLIPLSLLNKELKSGNKDVGNIARVFDVSKESIWWKLRECNLISKL